MTACDLIASAKPWEIQTETVKVIFEEFYEQVMQCHISTNKFQGDAERAIGKEPIAMMDRHKAHELPKMQVGFMSGICVPCYETLAQVIPHVKPLVEKAKYNLDKWKQLADEQEK